MRPVVMLGAESLRRGASGIARVARLVARLLAEKAGAGRLDARALALSDPSPAGDLGLPVRSARGSRARFVLEVHREALRSTHCIYDFAGMARAHPRLPGLRRPYLAWAHGIEVWEEARTDRLVRLREAAVLAVNSAYTRDRMSRLHPNLGRAHLCWLATEEDTAPDRVASDSHHVLILSRLDGGGGYKGHRELIECWPKVISAVPEARLSIAGDGPGMATIRAWVKQSPACDHIDLLGFVHEAQLQRLWDGAAIFAMPSRGEGFGLTYIEAMRQGVPVIASVHDAGAEINADGVTGYNVDLGRPGALSDAIVALLRDPAARERMGRAGHARWEEHFRYHCFRERFTPLLEQLLMQ